MGLEAKGILEAMDDEIKVNSAVFSGNLSAADDNVAKALITLDAMSTGSTGLTTFITPTIVANPDVASGNEVDIFSFTLPANSIADGDRIAIDIFQEIFSTDGVPDLNQSLVLDDGILPVVTNFYNNPMNMPNNVSYYPRQMPQILRVGANLYINYISPATSEANGGIGGLFSASPNNNHQLASTFCDIGGPDFTQPITITFKAQLTGASANAVYRVLNAEIRQIKSA